MWVGATGCEEIISSTWQSMEYFDLVEGLRSDVSLCSYHLKQWHGGHFGNIQAQLGSQELNKLLANAHYCYPRLIWIPLDIILIF